MKERGIPFSPPMVLAVLAGTKTQTRRVCKTGDRVQAAFVGKSPYGVTGDRLWVREAWRAPKSMDNLSGTGIADACTTAGYKKPWSPLKYEADGHLNSVKDWREFGNRPGTAEPGRYRYARFMPRWASRINLDVVEVRIERLQDISEADAKAEGCEAEPHGTWWQGYRDCGGTVGLNHEHYKGDEPPDWMIEPHKDIPRPWLDRTARSKYELLWDTINGPGSWALNPWVWVVTFKRVPA